MSVLDKLRMLTRAAGNHRDGSYSIVILAPIRAGARDALARTLGDLGPDSPLAALDEVHFGRWIVIDQLKTDFPGRPKRPAQLDCPYLLFSAEYTPPGGDYAPPRTFLERLVRVPKAADVWAHCEGFGTDEAQRVAFLAKHRCDTTLYFAGYPGVSPERVKAALRRRKALTRFVLDHRDERDAATLQRRYLEEAARWF